jgi:hypothetical protein
VARDEAGGLAEVERYDRWTCDGPVDLSPGKCGEPGSYYYVPYIDRSRADWIAAHGAGSPAGERVDVVRRIWWLDPTRAPRVEDCVLQRCTAVRR